MCSVSICVEDIASTWTKPPMSAQRFQRCHSIAKLTYGASAWIDFTRASERQRIEAFIRHCVRSELCSVNTKTFAEMCDTYDYRPSQFNNITRNLHHIHQLLHSVSAAAENYNLRSRKHNRMLPQRTTRLFDSNFIYRALYSDIY